MTEKVKNKVNADLIRSLSDLLDDTGLAEIEYGEGDWHIRVVRTAVPIPIVSAPAPAEDSPVVKEDSADRFANHSGQVPSPMVGVVYTSPEPDSPPFVKVGDTVSQGDTLVLIEAMKVFNPIKAPQSGRVVRVFVANGDPVEFGEPLMVIE